MLTRVRLARIAMIVGRAQVRGESGDAPGGAPGTCSGSLWRSRLGRSGTVI